MTRYQLMDAIKKPTKADWSRMFVLARLRRDNGCTVYISERPGQGGVDWGYAVSREKAVPQSLYWTRRWLKDMSECSKDLCHAQEVDPATGAVLLGR